MLLRPSGAVCGITDCAAADAPRITRVDESVFDPGSIDDVHGARIPRYRGVYVDADSEGLPYAAIVEADRSVPITQEMLLEEQQRLTH